MFNGFTYNANAIKAALCLAVIFDYEIARDVAVKGEVGPSACYGMP